MSKTSISLSWGGPDDKRVQWWASHGTNEATGHSADFNSAVTLALTKASRWLAKEEAAAIESRAIVEQMMGENIIQFPGLPVV